VGGHFLRAAASIGVKASLVNVMSAYAGPRLVKALCWHLLGRRPPRLGAFGREVAERCVSERPDLVLSIGLAPLSAEAVGEIRRMGIKTANFLTDDPWNEHHHTPSFMRALPCYDHVFTPRRANMGDLEAIGGPRVHYLPFAYAPDVHHPPEVQDAGELRKWQSDVLFIGGADDERAGVIRALVQRGLMPGLWGGYWERYRDLSPHSHGHADAEAFRHLVDAARVNLCLVRRANRDGHSMRSYELPAVGGCLAVEDTEEHREMFGPEGECVSYFRSMDALGNLCHFLLEHPEECRRRTQAVHERICREGRNTYADRLETVLVKVRQA
jgi:hypothetical protein